jgi:hypothetical protein
MKLAVGLKNETKAPNSTMLVKTTLEMFPTIHTIYQVCQIINFDWRSTVFAISAYSDRNETMHSRPDLLLDEGVPQAIAELLFEDLHDLPKVFSSDQAAEETILESVVGGLIARWFDKPEHTQIQPNAWHARKSCRTYWRNEGPGVRLRKRRQKL